MIRLIIVLLAGLFVLAQASDRIFPGQTPETETIDEVLVLAEAAPVIGLVGTPRPETMAISASKAAEPSEPKYAGRVAKDTFVPFNAPMIVADNGLLARVD